MNKFAQNFAKVLNEDDMERQAMEASLDDDIDPTAFDANMEMSPEEAQVTDEVSDAMSRRNQQIIDELQGWIDKVDEFLNFLNSEDPNSVQSRLAAAEPDTVMDKMKQSQQTKISRVASDLASLHQNFLGYMAQTSNARFKYVSIAWGLLSALSVFGASLSNFC
tara:strand:- start:1765 stop:2256 length:492 start_codon:yes stop_codon:yes gene_type:complete